MSIEPPTDRSAYDFSHRIRARFAETDAMGIVHHSRYLPYLEEARVEYLRHIGHPYHEIRAEGVDMAVLEAGVQYRQPLKFDDVVDVHVARGRSLGPPSRWCTCSPSMRSSTRRASPFTAQSRLKDDSTRLPAWLRGFSNEAPGT